MTKIFNTSASSGRVAFVTWLPYGSDALLVT